MSRPTKDVEERLHLRIPVEEKQRLEQLAKSRGLTLSAFVRRVLLGIERVEVAVEPIR